MIYKEFTITTMPNKAIEPPTESENKTETPTVAETQTENDSIVDSSESENVVTLTREELIYNIKMDLTDLLSSSTDSPTIVKVNRILEIVNTL